MDLFGIDFGDPTVSKGWATELRRTAVLATFVIVSVQLIKAAQPAFNALNPPTDSKPRTWMILNGLPALAGTAASLVVITEAFTKAVIPLSTVLVTIGGIWGCVFVAIALNFIVRELTRNLYPQSSR